LRDSRPCNSWEVTCVLADTLRERLSSLFIFDVASLFFLVSPFYELTNLAYRFIPVGGLFYSRIRAILGNQE
jgi:hypothetical protein